MLRSTAAADAVTTAMTAMNALTGGEPGSGCPSTGRMAVLIL